MHSTKVLERNSKIISKVAYEDVKMHKNTFVILFLRPWPNDSTKVQKKKLSEMLNPKFSLIPPCSALFSDGEKCSERLDLRQKC